MKPCVAKTFSVSKSVGRVVVCLLHIAGVLGNNASTVAGAKSFIAGDIDSPAHLRLRMGLKISGPWVTTWAN